jgi:hypothetical protein
MVNGGAEFEETGQESGNAAPGGEDAAEETIQACC